MEDQKNIETEKRKKGREGLWLLIIWGTVMIIVVAWIWDPWGPNPPKLDYPQKKIEEKSRFLQKSSDKTIEPEKSKEEYLTVSQAVYDEDGNEIIVERKVPKEQALRGPEELRLSKYSKEDINVIIRMAAKFHSLCGSTSPYDFVFDEEGNLISCDSYSEEDLSVSEEEVNKYKHLFQ